MPSIFITRQQSATSPFQNILTDQGYRVHGESLIQLKAMEFNEFPMTDWIFFYSKNAVRFFFEILKKQSLTIPMTTKYAVMGAGTAAAIATYHITPDFVGTGHPTETAMAFKTIAKKQSVLFPRAYTSHQSIQNLLADELETNDLIVYQNSPRTNINLPEVFDVLVFTSSLNAKAYFAEFEVIKQQRVIAIGQPTAATLNELGVDQVVIAKQPTEEALAAACMIKFLN